MRIIVTQNEKVLLDYINTNKNLNKIPNTFEKLTTQMKCPQCGCVSLIEEEKYLPSIDVICTNRLCRHTIEVKSILAEGSQSKAWVKDKKIKIKLGSVNTYANITKYNKSLILFWYNIIETTETESIIKLRNCILIPMEKFREGLNCKTSIVLQKKKTKYKQRISLEIFPEFSYAFTHIVYGDFSYINSMYTNRQNIAKFLVEFSKFLKCVKAAKLKSEEVNENRIIHYLTNV